MLIVYGKATTSFTNNGLGVLTDYRSNPLITEVLNGEYLLEFDYSAKGKSAEHLI